MKAFFVTNQAVPDRKRAEVEDTLRTKQLAPERKVTVWL